MFTNQPWWHSPTWDQEVTDFVAAESRNILSGRFNVKYFLWSFTDHDVASRLLISTGPTPYCEKKTVRSSGGSRGVSLDSIEGGYQLK